MRWVVLVAAAAIGFGAGWIVKDVTTDDQQTAPRACVGSEEEFEAFEAVEDGREPACIPSRGYYERGP